MNFVTNVCNLLCWRASGRRSAKPRVHSVDGSLKETIMREETEGFTSVSTGRQLLVV